MSKSANTANKTEDMQEPTIKEFEEMLKEQSQYDTKKWADLELNKIYVITGHKTLQTGEDEKGYIVTIKDVGDVWCPAHLGNKIEVKKPPFYVRPLGLRPCKNNRKNKYHAYDLVVPKDTKFMHEDYEKN